MTDQATHRRIPIVILAGFLGAGKTTFLRELLSELATGKRPPYVILNDFINAEVDSASLRGLVTQVRAIAAGCVCCDAADGLVDALDAVPEDLNPVVIIEANGTTDPYPLLEIITSDTQLANRFGPIRQVAIINEARWQKRLFPWDRNLERAQLQSASHIFTNRSHNASLRQQHRVMDDIARINPHAVRTNPLALANEIAAEAASNFPRFASERSIRHEHHHAAARVEMPILTETQLRQWLSALPQGVVRVKGVCQLENGDVIHFQRTDDPSEPPAMLAGAIPDSITPCAILIGPKVDAVVASALLEDIMDATASNQ